MNDEGVKKRAWVKNAAIIFLSAMLVLTFFSNTIMNRSLPEVAARYTTSGTINTMIRGMGDVSANENYELVISQTRTVSAVFARVGDAVETGDILFTLEGTGSEEADGAREALHGLLHQYELDVVRATLTVGSDYAREVRNIQFARTDFETAQSELDGIPYSEINIELARDAIVTARALEVSAKAAVSSAQSTVDTRETAVERAKTTVATAEGTVESRTAEVRSAQDALDNLPGPNTSRIRQDIADEEEKRNNMQAEIASAEIVHGANFESYIEYAKTHFSSPSSISGEPPADWETRRPVYLAAYAQLFSESERETNPYVIAYDTLTGLYGRLSGIETELGRLNNSLSNMLGANSQEHDRLSRALRDARSALTTAERDLNTAERTLSDAERLLIAAEWTLENAETDLKEAEDDLKESEDELETQLDYKDNWIKASADVAALDRNLEDLLFELSEQQRADGVGDTIHHLEMAEKRRVISLARENIGRLEQESVGAAVISPVSGVIAELISVLPGSPVQAGSVVAVIEVADRGYSLNFRVTLEQSRMVSIGDVAEINRMWWDDNDVRAVLTSIRNDPENPATGRILVFDISGDGTESGMQLSLSVGQRSLNYETIVPNSALRTDTNGDFVLVVVERRSPLGNRYVAMRADVNVLAADDTNSAVSGGLTGGGNFVITTSTRPIQAGSQVRLVDNP